MFSMKYTSPRVTPKKGAPPAPGEEASPPSHPLAYCAAPADDDERGGSVVRTTSTSATVGFTGEDVDVVRPLLPSTRQVERNPFTALTEADLLPPAGGRASSEASENDSSVANNVSDDVLAPRSNLLSLLDLDYRASGGGSGEEGPRETAPRSDGVGAGADGADAAAGERRAAVEKGDGIGRETVEGQNENWSPMHLLGLPDLRETEGSSGANFGYLRSSSLEPLCGEEEEQPEEEDAVPPVAGAASPGVESADATTRAPSSFAKQGGSLQIPRPSGGGSASPNLDGAMRDAIESGVRIPFPSGGETQNDDERSASPNLGGGESTRSFRTMHDTSGAHSASPTRSEIDVDGIGGNPESRSPPTISASLAVESTKVATPFVKPGGSVQIPYPSGGETLNNDKRSASPNLGGGENSRLLPTIHDTSGAHSASPTGLEIDVDGIGGNPEIRSPPTIYGMSVARPASPILSEVNADRCGDRPLVQSVDSQVSPNLGGEENGRSFPTIHETSGAHYASPTRSEIDVVGIGGRPESRSPPTIYDMSAARPASPILSEVNADRYGDRPSVHSVDSRAYSDVATESEIGGDFYFRPQGKKPRADSIGSDGMVHVPLPPRVNRTTSNGDDSAPFLPPGPPPLRANGSDCPSTPTLAMATPLHSPLFITRHAPLPVASPLIPFSPRPRPFASHTHSLLDDCSDEEDETTSFLVVDSPTRHMPATYSCLLRPRPYHYGEGSPFSSYFRNKQHQRRPRGGGRRGGRPASAGTSVCRVAQTNHIQQALLQTRHRRWDCQSAYAGAHAQSSRSFDLSHRFHDVVGGPRSIDGDGPSTRLSVPPEAVRAAALASGLWRTVQVVRLPRGLFWSRPSAGMDESARCNEVWAVLKMLHATFPHISQVDFGGDISRARNDPNNEDVAIDDDWRDEIISCIMECLPNIVAIDGFVVERHPHGSASRDEGDSTASEEAGGLKSDASNSVATGGFHDRREEMNAVESSSACVDCEPQYICGLSEFVDGDTQNVRLNASIGSRSSNGDLRDIALSPYRANIPNHTEEATYSLGKGPNDSSVTAKEKEDVKKDTPKINDDPWHEYTDDARKIPTPTLSSSMVSSSRSWGSTGSGSRPPTCPNSSARPRARLPTKPSDKKAMRGSFMKAGAAMKRQVLGLIPSVSMMDEDEDSSDDSEQMDDCPTDLL